MVELSGFEEWECSLVSFHKAERGLRRGQTVSAWFGYLTQTNSSGGCMER
jgi:hypothetical protein